MLMKLSIEEGRVVRVFGPANIVVDKGSVMVVGAVFKSNERFVINRFRSYAIKALENSELSITLGDGGSVEEPKEGEEVIDEWVEISEYVVNNKLRKVMVLGPVDSGKTSLVTFIANYALGKGLKVGIIDADVGQEDLAPPCFIALAIPNKYVLWLRELTFHSIRFVGSITPSGNVAKVIQGVKSLTDKAEGMGVDLVVIDTDGWVNNSAALEYKFDLIKIVKPDALVVVDEYLYEVFKNLEPIIKVIYAPRPKVVRVRSREERKYLRTQAYKRFFMNSKVRKFSINELTLFGSCLLSGKPLPNEVVDKVKTILSQEVLRASQYGEVVTILTKGRSLNVPALREIFRNVDINLLAKGDEKGVLLALLNKDLEEVGVGLLENLDLDNGLIVVRTCYEGDVGGIIFGKVKLNKEFEEVLKSYKCVI
ncbi:MAG TPA: hypothetical protein ENF75_05750 [Acidilobales archaeon]|nr:MAG: hypothetical protein B6U85_06890 [Desulfurococcales archaeon ex4484_42]HDD26573.1 hypothetical protein [Acidilobales archaeon]